MDEFHSYINYRFEEAFRRHDEIFNTLVNDQFYMNRSFKNSKNVNLSYSSNSRKVLNDSCHSPNDNSFSDFKHLHGRPSNNHVSLVEPLIQNHENPSFKNPKSKNNYHDKTTTRIIEKTRISSLTPSIRKQNTLAREGIISSSSCLTSPIHSDKNSTTIRDNHSIDESCFSNQPSANHRLTQPSHRKKDGKTYVISRNVIINNSYENIKDPDTTNQNRSFTPASAYSLNDIDEDCSAETHNITSSEYNRTTPSAAEAIHLADYNLQYSNSNNNHNSNNNTINNTSCSSNSRKGMYKESCLSSAGSSRSGSSVSASPRPSSVSSTSYLHNATITTASHHVNRVSKPTKQQVQHTTSSSTSTSKYHRTTSTSTASSKPTITSSFTSAAVKTVHRNRRNCYHSTPTDNTDPNPNPYHHHRHRQEQIDKLRLTHDGALIDQILGDILLPADVTTTTTSTTADTRTSDTSGSSVLSGSSALFEGIAGNESAKQALREAVILPALLPELFTGGLRQPWKGILLFGPPGTGKTMLARAVAHIAGSTFFHTSASSLLSKWHGESEKLVKCLFAVARVCAPAIVFVDEADCLLSHRGGSGSSGGSGEHEASRRMKAQFLCEMDGLVSNNNDDNSNSSSSTSSSNTGSTNNNSGNTINSINCVTVLAATNCPWDLDAAVLRRLEKRIYVPMPDTHTRRTLFELKLAEVDAEEEVRSPEFVTHLAERTVGYSAADIHTVCKEAAMSPMRRYLADHSLEDIMKMKNNDKNNNNCVYAAASHATTSFTVTGLGGTSASASYSTSASGSGSSGTEIVLPKVTKSDFEAALLNIKPSVSVHSVNRYEQWNEQFKSY